VSGAPRATALGDRLAAEPADTIEPLGCPVRFIRACRRT
jgi:hypothetical protein